MFFHIQFHLNRWSDLDFATAFRVLVCNVGLYHCSKKRIKNVLIILCAFANARLTKIQTPCNIKKQPGIELLWKVHTFIIFLCGTYELLRRKIQRYLLSKCVLTIILFEAIDYIISGVDKRLEANGLESIVQPVTGFTVGYITCCLKSSMLLRFPCLLWKCHEISHGLVY